MTLFEISIRITLIPANLSKIPQHSNSRQLKVIQRNELHEKNVSYASRTRDGNLLFITIREIIALCFLYPTIHFPGCLHSTQLLHKNRRLYTCNCLLSQCQQSTPYCLRFYIPHSAFLPLERSKTVSVRKRQVPTPFPALCTYFAP